MEAQPRLCVSSLETEQQPYLSSCWAAVVSSVSSSSVFSASSSSPRSRFSFSALPRETFSDSRSSCSSPSAAWSSRTCFRAMFFWLFSSSLLVEQTWMLVLGVASCSFFERERERERPWTC